MVRTNFFARQVAEVSRWVIASATIAVAGADLCVIHAHFKQNPEVFS